MTDFIRMKGDGRVKMNVGEPKVSEVQAAVLLIPGPTVFLRVTLKNWE